MKKEVVWGLIAIGVLVVIIGLVSVFDDVLFSPRQKATSCDRPVCEHIISLSKGELSLRDILDFSRVSFSPLGKDADLTGPPGVSNLQTNKKIFASKLQEEKSK